MTSEFTAEVVGEIRSAPTTTTPERSIVRRVAVRNLTVENAGKLGFSALFDERYKPEDKVTIGVGYNSESLLAAGVIIKIDRKEFETNEEYKKVVLTKLETVFNCQPIVY
ncbi:MAG: hypothetical protein ACHQUA_00145 [Microgenomates group bacterium]